MQVLDNKILSIQAKTQQLAKLLISLKTENETLRQEVHNLKQELEQRFIEIKQLNEEGVVAENESEGSLNNSILEELESYIKIIDSTITRIEEL
jgi:regulator of replication initiation timing